MSLRRISAEDAIARAQQFSAIIDVRSESEFSQDRLPGAVNWPVLDDEQRRRVGTLFTQVSAFEARKLGAALVAANIAHHVQQEVQALPRSWQPLVYCWRGGQRSASLALVLDQIGFAVHVLDGGYTAFRRLVRAQLDALPSRLSLRVLCGRTGTGKSRLLKALATEGAQVLDLEGLACHRGSVLGPLPALAQPTQKAFETALWQALRGFDPSRAVFAEGESRTIGRLRLPEALLLQLRAAPCIRVDLPLAGRVQLLLEDYTHFVQDVSSFCDRLQALRELRGAATVQRWQTMAHADQLAVVVEELLQQHYDPVYERSMARNFEGLAQAPVLALPDPGRAALARAARQLMQDASSPWPGPGSADASAAAGAPLL